MKGVILLLALVALFSCSFVYGACPLASLRRGRASYPSPASPAAAPPTQKTAPETRFSSARAEELIKTAADLNHSAKQGYARLKQIQREKLLEKEFKKPLLVVKPHEVVLLKDGKSYSELVVDVQYIAEKGISHITLGIFGLIKMYTLHAASGHKVGADGYALSPSSAALAASFVLDDSVCFVDNGQTRNLTQTYFDEMFDRYLTLISAFEAESPGYVDTSNERIKLLLAKKFVTEEKRKEYNELFHMDDIKEFDTVYFKKLKNIINRCKEIGADAASPSFQEEVVKRFSELLPHLFTHITRATFLTVYDLDEVLTEKWIDILPEKELKEDTLVLLLSDHMLRDNYLFTQYMQVMINETVEGKKMIFIEGQYEDAQYYMNAVIHLVDASLSEDVFQVDGLYMHKDLLGYPGEKIIPELFRMKGVLPPVEDESGIWGYLKTKKFNFLEVLIGAVLLFIFTLVVTAVSTALIVTLINKRKSVPSNARILNEEEME